MPFADNFNKIKAKLILIIKGNKLQWYSSEETEAVVMVVASCRWRRLAIIDDSDVSNERR